MKYAILADVHANLAALQAVLRDMEKQGCTHAACLGDIAGYGRQPKECLDLIRNLNIPCVKGNFDEYCSSDHPLTGFNAKATEQIRWTREQLSEEDRRWLRSLKLVEIVAGFTLVHASLNEPMRWEYVFDKMSAATSFQHQATQVCFFGHTHVPVAFIRDTVVRGGTFSKLKVERGKGYFVNPGSVGQPRDGSRSAAYVIYDLTEQLIELRKVDYDSGGSPGGTGPIHAPLHPAPTQPGGAHASESQ
jgi:predicted phosphodiesterase